MKSLMLELIEWNSVEEAAEHFKAQGDERLGLVSELEMDSLNALKDKLEISPEELVNAIDALLSPK